MEVLPDHEKPPAYPFHQKKFEDFRTNFLNADGAEKEVLNWTASPRVDLEATIRFQHLGTATTSGRRYSFFYVWKHPLFHT
jgi:hypothetical protein